jgi:hypothetical protein
MSKIHEPAEKKIGEMSAQEKRLFAAAMTWEGKALPDCTKTELIACVLHMTGQVVFLKNKLDKVTPFYMRPYWHNRFYWRGSSWLGLLNTILGVLFNRVVVLEMQVDGIKDKIVGWKFDLGTNHPRSK